jgi:hypothetical protein
LDNNEFLSILFLTSDEEETPFKQEPTEITQRGKAATKFWILDFGFWIEEKEAISSITRSRHSF